MILTKGKQPLNIISLCAVITIFLGSWLCDVTSDVWAEIKETRNVSKQPPSGEKVKYNRLIHESSPYLLQHATNPVNWFPWGDEAFERATKEDKPIFLSIGYSTCHWCHVMEHESFADQEVADLLNKYFISIKVDREERPDIDQVYMSVTQALTGSGGWPMTIVMTPDKKPFFAGTYFPKNSRWGRSGMMELLPKIAEAWRMEQEKILAGAEQITQYVIGLNERSATAFSRKRKAHSSVKR